MATIGVIGGGTTGVAAAYYAAASGHDVYLFDQFGLHNPYASSAGSSRFFRIMYSDPLETQLVESSYALWKEIEVASGREILVPAPLIFYGHKAGGRTAEGDIPSTRATMTAMGAPYRYLESPAAIANAFPVFDASSMPEDYVGLVQDNSATINVSNSFAAFKELAEASGRCQIVTPAIVDDIQQANSKGFTLGYRLASGQSQQERVDYLVIAPGAWVNSVLGYFGWRAAISIWQMTIGYYKVSGKHPLWYEFGNTSQDEQNLWYGFPEFALPGHVKASADFTNTTFKEPWDIDWQPDYRLLDRLSRFMQHRFRDVVAVPPPEAPYVQTCLYSMSTDGQMVLGRIPARPGYLNPERAAMFVLAAGRGFKFTPLVGRILVELATTGQTRYDMSIWNPTRKGVLSPLDAQSVSTWRATSDEARMLQHWQRLRAEVRRVV